MARNGDGALLRRGCGVSVAPSRVPSSLGCEVWSCAVGLAAGAVTFVGTRQAPLVPMNQRLAALLFLLCLLSVRSVVLQHGGDLEVENTAYVSFNRLFISLTQTWASTLVMQGGTADLCNIRRQLFWCWFSLAAVSCWQHQTPGVRLELA